MTRREFIRLLATSAGMTTIPTITSASPKIHVAVVGAGAFGGWTALHLLRKGAKVTLIDCWGAGNSRASSGGETRVTRGVYGNSQIYVKWAARSLQLWKENESRFGRKILTQTGAIWFVQDNEEYITPSLPFLKEEGLEYEKWSVQDAAAKYPQINLKDVRWLLYEKDAGVLLARQSCQAVLQLFLNEGGQFLLSAAKPGKIASQNMESISLQNGSEVSADQYVFACGPWLHGMFPSLPKNIVEPTRQEVFFFGPPAGDSRFTEKELPVWVDYGKRLIYGIPGNENRGFKVADDTRGESFDPTSGERLVSQKGIEEIRKFLAYRFPLLKDAPLVESRVCQYENSPDGHFVIDRHPEASNVWIVGGGSGHGFKHGPALGEYTASLIYDGKTIDPFFALARLKG